MDDVNQLLKKGIQALKAGQREQARALLMQVIEVDEENERAWLWLSGAVGSDEERRICLENVLTLNPNNELARKGLVRLKPVDQDEIELPPSLKASTPQEIISEPISEAFLPPSLEARAAQLAKPEPQVEKGWWAETPIIEPSASTTFKQYHDVWSTHGTMCAYCAAPIEWVQSRCPQCKRKLLVKALLNPIPSKHHGRLFIWMIIYLVLFAGLVLYAVVNAPQISPDLDRAALLTQGISASLPLIALTVGIYQRLPWAYWLLLIRAIAEIGLFFWISMLFLSILSEIGMFGFFISVRNEPSLFFVTIIFTLLLIILFFDAYTIYMAGGDFKRIPVRRIATVNDRLKDPGLLDRIAQRLAKEGLWASAVLYWQRAVGRASGHAPYLLRLGHVYAELGFYERSVDIFKSALEAVRSPEVRQEIEKELVQVTRLSRAAEAEGKGEGGDGNR